MTPERPFYGDDRVRRVAEVTPGLDSDDRRIDRADTKSRLDAGGDGVMGRLRWTRSTSTMAFVPAASPRWRRAREEGVVVDREASGGSRLSRAIDPGIAPGLIWNTSR